MTSQTIQDDYNHHGDYDYNPVPPPDHIARTVKRLNFDDGAVYEGEVDEQDKPDGRGDKLFANGHFH